MKRPIGVDCGWLGLEAQAQERILNSDHRPKASSGREAAVTGRVFDPETTETMRDMGKPDHVCMISITAANHSPTSLAYALWDIGALPPDLTPVGRNRLRDCKAVPQEPCGLEVCEKVLSWDRQAGSTLTCIIRNADAVAICFMACCPIDHRRLQESTYSIGRSSFFSCPTLSHSSVWKKMILADVIQTFTSTLWSVKLSLVLIQCPWVRS